MSTLNKMNQALATYEITGTDDDYATYKELYNQWVKTWIPSPYPYED